MENYDIEDTLTILSDYLALMWCIHEGFTGVSTKELNRYRTGIQTYLELSIELVEKSLKKLESK